jgi:mercuric ion transport protein
MVLAYSRRSQAKLIGKSRMNISGDKLFKTGVIGAIIAVICCLLPPLAVLVGFTGAAAIFGYLDFVLIPVVLIAVALIGYGLWKRSRK